MHRRSRHRAFPRLLIFAALIMVGALILGWRIWPRPAPSEAAPEKHAEATPVAKNTKKPATSAPPPKKAEPARSKPRRSPAEPSGTSTADRRTEPASSPQNPSVEMGRPVSLPATPKPNPNDARRVQTPPLLSRRSVIDAPSSTPPAPTKAVGADPASPAASASGSRTPRAARTQLDEGLAMLDRGDVINGRIALSRLLYGDTLSPSDAARVRDRLTEVNERLVFSPEIHPRDPFVVDYALAPGDRLSKVPGKLGVQTDWRFVARINQIKNPTRIRAGDRVKLIKGPFHAVVLKSEYRLDLYMGEDRDRIYVRSFDVGLGEYDRTPTGRFRVRPGSKLINPQWVNPRTRELFAPDDPKNPIGEHWLGLEGLDDHNKDLEGYGIHGTIDPDSIGQQASMGCIRMHKDDVAIVWEVLIERVSTTEIR